MQKSKWVLLMKTTFSLLKSKLKMKFGPSSTGTKTLFVLIILLPFMGLFQSCSKQGFSSKLINNSFGSVKDSSSPSIPIPNPSGGGAISNPTATQEGGHTIPTGGGSLAPSTVSFDAPTTRSISLLVTDDIYDSVEVYYKRAAHSTWYRGLDLFQHQLSSGAPFAGMLFNLSVATTYDIVVVAYSNQSFSSLALTYSTRSIPIYADASLPGFRVVNVASQTELKQAIKQAQPGDIITLAANTTIEDNVLIAQKSGTATHPITLRGAPGYTSQINAGGSGFCIRLAASNYIHMEGLHLANGRYGVSSWQGSSQGNRGNVFRKNLVTQVEVGYSAPESEFDLYIVDNNFQGINPFGDVSNATWNDEGIAATGEGIEIAFNTLSGFGDSLGLKRGNQRSSNKGIDIHHNFVLFGGDNGIELDFTGRNVAAHHNLLSNTGDGISFQMSDFGPSYAFKNVIYSILPGRGPYKIKPEARCNSGVFILNNTAINSGRGDTNFSGCGQDINIINNLYTGDGSQPDVIRADTSHWTRLNWSHNAFLHDGRVQIGSLFASSFESWKESSAGANDVLLTGAPVFADQGLIMPSQPFPANKASSFGLGSYLNPIGLDARLSPLAKAVDQGKKLWGISPFYSGVQPDIGAFELGEDLPQYGTRIIFP